MLDPTRFDPLYTSVTVAQIISGLSRSGIYRGIAAGRLKTKKAGRRTLVNYADLMALLDALPDGLSTSSATNARGSSDAA